MAKSKGEISKKIKEEIKKNKKDKKMDKENKDKEKEIMDRYNSKKDNKAYLDVLCEWVNDLENKTKEDECYTKWCYSIATFHLLFGTYEVFIYFKKIIREQCFHGLKEKLK